MHQPENYKSRRALESLSPLEKLPGDVFLEIISYIPESLLNLRPVSWRLMFRVHDHIISNCTRQKRGKAAARETRKLLRLHLLLQCPTDITTLITRRFSGNVIVYNFSFSSFGSTSACNKMQLTLQNTQLGELEVQTDYRNDDSVIDLVNNHTRGKALDKAKKGTQRKYSSAKPVIFLLSLSSIVRSMRIYQPPVAGIDRRSNFLLGIFNVDWAWIFQEMFSRKLDKLKVQNREFLGYLPIVSADELIARIPEIGKLIWFEASSDTYPYGLRYDIHDHAVQAEPSFVQCGSLSIKHLLRKNEPFSR